MLSLNTWIALAMSPISSALPREGISTARSPPASSPIARVIEVSGPTMLRAIRTATINPNRVATPPTISCIDVVPSIVASAWLRESL